MNRFFRRLQSFGKHYSGRRSAGSARPADDEVVGHCTPQDVTSTRAKSARHKKVTADNWNQ